MGIAAQFERRLAALVEGVFAGRSGLEPLEIARKLQREMGEHRKIGLRGEVLVPNAYMAHLNPDDHSRIASVEHALAAEMAAILRSHADDEGWALLGPTVVELVADAGVKRGRVEVGAMYKEPDGPTGGSIVMPDGRTIEFRGDAVAFGRLSECEIPLNDPNVSRRHAEIRWDGRGYVVTDLSSLNGTYVNGVRVGEAALRNGDVLTIGRTQMEVRLP